MTTADTTALLEKLDKPVKPLEWRNDPSGDFDHWWGDSAIGSYGISGGREWLLQHPLGMRLNTGHDTLEAAKAAAEADHSARILSALSLTPSDLEAIKAALVAKTAEFAQYCIQAAFDGCDMGGDAIQEMAVQCGLLKPVAFDPAIHKDPEGYSESGDPWFVYSDEFRAALGKDAS